MTIMMTQNDIAAAIGTIGRTYVNKLLTGKRKVSWPLAERLSKLVPGRTIQQWKKAGPDELKRAFEQLQDKEVA